MEIATFGEGCFWGSEATFAHLNGVVATRVGYAGGNVPDPSYEEVCRGKTGHTEVVEVTFDPQVISYEKLLHIFFESHSPTLPTKTQYRSVIFYHSPAQRDTAIAVKEQLANSACYSRPILTDILPAPPFYMAEEYHQHYEDKHGPGACGYG